MTEERELIASVFVNRLKLKILLQCDPTVIYALEKANRYRGRLTPSRPKFNSPYNTYRYPGSASRTDRESRHAFPRSRDAACIDSIPLFRENDRRAPHVFGNPGGPQPCRRRLSRDDKRAINRELSKRRVLAILRETGLPLIFAGKNRSRDTATDSRHQDHSTQCRLRLSGCRIPSACIGLRRCQSASRSRARTRPVHTAEILFSASVRC